MEAEMIGLSEHPEEQQKKLNHAMAQKDVADHYICQTCLRAIDVDVRLCHSCFMYELEQRRKYERR